MNSAKKIMKQQEDAANSKKKKASAAKGTATLSDGGMDYTKRIVISAICIVLVLVLCIGVGVQQLKPEYVVKINDTKISLNDMMYPIYERESRYLPYNEMYQMYMGTTVWDASYMGDDRKVDASSTNAVGLKQEILDTEIEYEVLYQEAKKAGYTLSDEDKTAVKEEVSEALKGLTFLQRSRLDISKGKLTKRFEKRKLADNYKKDRQAETDATVDEKDAVKDISKKDYREYKVQYYSASTVSTDEDGKETKLGDKEKKDLQKKMEELLEKDAKDFTKLVDEKEKDITFAEDSFTEKDGWNIVQDKKILNEIKGMKNDAISKIYEDKESNRILFVKMVDNNSSEAYDTACENALTEAKNTAYDTWYDGIRKGYSIEAYSDVWADVKIGEMTTDIVTLEDLQKMNEDSSDASSAQ